MSTKKDKFSTKDQLFMEIALDLAKAREGLTHPNPSVGCVITKNNEIISIGQTSVSGRPHAELNAIKNSTVNLNGSTMYVTLEPCNHHGVSPPCTNAIIKSKISKVIYSITDIDKRVKGKTFKILKSHNIKVRQGLLKEKITQFYLPYFFNKKKKLPYERGKIAITKNNFLRYKNDSILISYKTLNKDNPKLNCRLKNMQKFSPKRIILDNKLKSNINSYIFKTANKKNTIFFYNEASNLKIIEFKKKKIKIIKAKLDSNKRFHILIVLRKLYNLGCRNIIVEGGNELTKNLLKKKIFNQFYLFESQKKISKSTEYKEFNGLNILKQKYKNSQKINSNFGNDKITLYKR